MSKTIDERGVIITDSLKLPEFSRELPFWTPVILRAVRESPFYENRAQSALETPQTEEERVFGGGLSDFLRNKNYIVMVLTHYETMFKKPYKQWANEDWHTVSHFEAQALLPLIQQGCLSERDIKPIWGEKFLALKPEQRIAKVIQLLTTFLYQVFEVAITRADIKELIKQSRSDTIAPLVSDHPSSKPPVAHVAEWEGQFQQFFAQVPPEYQGKDYQLYYRFAFFRGHITDAFEKMGPISSVSAEAEEHAIEHVQKQTGISYDVIRKAYRVYIQDPELVKNPNSPISHIMDRERSMRLQEAKRQLEKEPQSINSIKTITQGLTSVRGDNPMMPQGAAMQIVTAEGMVACIYADEHRMVVRYPRLEYDMHKIYEKVCAFVQAQRASGREIVSSAAFKKLDTMLSSQVDNVFNTYYTQIAYNQSHQVLAELRKNVEERKDFHVEHITKVLEMVSGLKACVREGFNPMTFKALERLFMHDNTEWNETMAWLSSPAIVSGDMTDEKYANILGQVEQIVDARSEIARIRAAKPYFVHLKKRLREYISHLQPSEHGYAKASIDALTKLEQKWKSFSDCYDALSTHPDEDQASKQEFLLWLNILHDTLHEQEKQLQNIPQIIEQQFISLKNAMCEGEVNDSVWGWAQKQYEMRHAGQARRLDSAGFVPLVRRFTLDDDTMKMIWQHWQEGMFGAVLNNQIPPEKENLHELILGNLPVFDQDIGRFPKIYPEFWYINPEQYLGMSESKVPLADAVIMTVNTDQGKLEQWQLLYTLGTLKLRKIADVPGGRGGRAQTIFTSEGH